MAGRRPHVLDWLLPRAGGREADEARRIAKFLGLLADDARCKRSERIGVEAAARAALARLDARALNGALGSLLTHVTEWSLGPDSFASCGRARHGLQEAWSLLEAERARGVPAPEVPAPGEPPTHLARRLLRCARESGAPDVFLRLWEARWEHVRHGARAAEGHWRALRDELRVRGAAAAQADAIHGVAACLLERGQVREARRWLDDELELVSLEPGLARMYAWSLLLSGDREAAAESTSAGDDARLPAPLAELRERVPAWAPLLGGEPPVARSWSGAEPAGESDARAELGAACLAVFALGCDGTRAVRRLEAAPALRGEVGDWLRARDGAWSARGEPEHALFARAVPVLRHRLDARPLRGALGGRGSLALALGPIRDRTGSVSGWLHVECEHHLLPSAARLERMARRLAPPVPPLAIVRSAGEEPRDETPLRELAAAFVAEQGLKVTRRRWWLFDVRADGARLVAEDGHALADWRTRRGGGEALGRALASGASVAFDGPDATLAQHAGARSGLALPLALAGRVYAVLVLESARRRDVGDAMLARLECAARPLALRWRAAQFRAWHLARFGHDVFFDPTRMDWCDRLAQVALLGRRRSPLAVVGERGVGKELLARWLHFESEDRERDYRVVSCAGELGWPGECGTLVLAHLEELAPMARARLARRLARGGGRSPRCIALATRPLSTLLGVDGPGRELASRLGRLALCVPPLRGRRNEIPFLVRALAARFAAQEGLAEPRVDDAGLAVLWRQPWEGNVRQLGELVHRAVALEPGGELGPPAIRRLAADLGLDLLARLPSRHPRAVDVSAALEATRKASGAVNKARAALYLGWDPDTLTRRMRDLTLDSRSAQTGSG